ncbi:hypothetical protein CVD28_24875 [Bacillus sp. M6-12]|uniref:hypothetical protein n=1 Tax=Bacillus sp. M6-12 TaxID=2054166 RepID=UPI000C76B783|nr:hypothetical protein [Bacillus sp. M6-12]PLS15072.1 hypothetical protein CVD28_24875 [Bacillus sp. M6-12]
MEFHQQIENTIKKRLKTSQLLLFVSVVIAVGVAFLAQNAGPSYYIWAMYFVVIGALALPNINKCKKDLIDYHKNVISHTEGKVLDLFPEKEESGKWIIFLDVEGKKDVVEFILPFKPSIQPESTIKVFHTNILKLPVRIEVA